MHFLLLINFYKKIGDDSTVIRLRQQWNDNYPERKLFNTAYTIKNTGYIEKAIPLFEQVITINPTYPDAWVNLGECLVSKRMYDSAVTVLAIASGLNPYEISVYNNMAVAYMNLGKYNKAESKLKKGLSIDKGNINLLMNLAWLYKLRKQFAKQYQCLKQAVFIDNPPGIVFKELGDYYFIQKDFSKAAKEYKHALSKGLDSSYVNDLLTKYPQLRKYFK